MHGVVPKKRKKTSVEPIAMKGESRLAIETTTKAELLKIFEGFRPKLNRLGVKLFLSEDEPDPEKVANMQELLHLQQDGTGMLSPLTIDLLKTASNFINKIISEQKRISGAIKIQALARGFLIRKQVSAVKPTMGPLMNIKKILGDLIKTEKQYITDLKSAINAYLVPCRARATTSEDCHDVAAVFSNLETILSVHQTLLREIQHIQNLRWPFFHGLGNLFMKHASEFQNYGDYAENFSTSRSMISNILGNKKHKFREVFEHGGSSKLQAILYMPLQRIAKYGEVLGAFLEYSSAIDPEEVELLSRAQAIMTNITELVGRKLDLADRYAELQEIQRLIVVEKPLQLHNGTRFLVHQGNITSVTLKKLHYFLFNDIILLCRSQGEKYKLLHKIHLVSATMEASAEGLYDLTCQQPSEKLKLQFRVTDKSLDNLERIQKQIFKHKKSGVVFGIPLKQILHAEKRNITDGGNGIPMLVEHIIEYLRKNALQTVGLLRMAGKFERIERLKRFLDNSSLTDYSSVRLDDYGIHDVAAVLRIFLSELPEPVIPFQFYEPLMDVQRNADLQIDDRVVEIKRIILSLPPQNTVLLKYLIRFLQDIEEYSDINKMSVSNLAIVFGPNLIRSEVETVQCALEMPLLQGIIQILIEHSDSIWGDKHPSQQARSGRLSVLFVGKDLQRLSQLSPEDASSRVQSRSYSEEPKIDRKFRPQPPIPRKLPERPAPKQITFSETTPSAEEINLTDSQNSLSSSLGEEPKGSRSPVPMIAKRNVSASRLRASTSLPSSAVRDKMKIFEPSKGSPVKAPSFPQQQRPLAPVKDLKLSLKLDEIAAKSKGITSPKKNPPSPRKEKKKLSKKKKKKEEKEKGET